MTMIYDPIPFVKLVQKFLLVNYGPIMGISRENIYNVICTICKCCNMNAVN